MWDFVGLKVLRAIEISLSLKRCPKNLLTETDRLSAQVRWSLDYSKKEWPLTTPKKVGHAAGCIAGDQAASRVFRFTRDIKHL